MTVSMFWSFHGTLAGGLACLLFAAGGSPPWWFAVGAVVGAILGGLVEADHLPA